jgi:hypothetical protein
MLTDIYGEYIVDDVLTVSGLTDFFLDKYNLQSYMGRKSGALGVTVELSDTPKYGGSPRNS